MRLFIAIELGEAVRKGLSDIQSKLKQANADVKWVEPKNIHLTLKFLGDTPEDKIQKIKDSLKEIAAQTSAFSIALSEIGAFPNLNSPRVIWVGIVGAGRDLPLLASGIEERLFKLGFAKENRQFSAHLTVGRMRSPKGRQELKKIIEDINVGATRRVAPTQIDHITLFQSTLTPKGPIYTDLYEAKLKPT